MKRRYWIYLSGELKGAEWLDEDQVLWLEEQGYEPVPA